MAKILIAEDEEVLRMLICDTLEDQDWELDEAADGEEALSLITENDYDLILLDYMMPAMTGLEVAEKARKLPGKEGVKIMLLTAKSQASDRERAMEAGADYFMSKPFSPKELADRVGEILLENT